MTRRSSVILSASGEGFRPSASSRARTKLSIGFLTQAAFFTAGRSGRFGAEKAQCVSHFAPSSIHSLMSSICLSLRVRRPRSAAACGGSCRHG